MSGIDPTSVVLGAVALMAFVLVERLGYGALEGALDVWGAWSFAHPRGAGVTLAIGVAGWVLGVTLALVWVGR